MIPTRSSSAYMSGTSLLAVLTYDSLFRDVVVRGKNCLDCDRFQFPCHLGSHIPSSLPAVCCIFVFLNNGVAANAWDLSRAHRCYCIRLHTGGRRDALIESALKVDPRGKTIPCCSGELNPCQWRAGQTVYRLKYTPAPDISEDKLPV